MSSLVKNIKTNYQVVNQIICVVEPYIDQLMDKFQAYYARNNQPFTARDREYAELSVIYKLVQAISNYTEKNDKLTENVKFSLSEGGHIKIDCKIERDGVEYYFHTYTIDAGGYNIQRYHHRYIVDTNIPKVSTTALNSIKEIEKRMKKEDRIKADIERTANYITILEKENAELESKTDEQIEEEFYGWWIERFGKKPSFDMLNEQAQKYYGSAEKYNEDIEKQKQEKFDQIKNRIKFNKQDIKKGYETIQKYKNKLASL